MVRAQIDSGSSVSLIAKSVADSVGVRYSGAGATIVGIGNRSLQSWIADVQRFRLGDETINNTQLRVSLVDNATRKMMFTYEGGPVFQISD